MIYIDHDFYSNFSNTVKVGDTDATYDILIDELSEIVVHDYQKIYDLMATLKINISKTSSDEDLINVIISQAKTNDKIIRGLSFLIAEKNNLITPQTDDATARKQIDAVNEKLTKTLKTLAENKNDNIRFKTDLLNKIQVKSTAVPSRNRKIKNGSNYWNYILVIGVAIGVVMIAYKYRDKIFKIETLEDGGALGQGSAIAQNVNPMPIQNPAPMPSASVNLSVPPSAQMSSTPIQSV